MTRRSLGFASFVAAAIVACASPPHAHAPTPEERFVLSADAPDAGEDSAGADRVVFQDPDSGNAFHGYWRVSDEDAERADQGVEGYLRGERPALADKLDEYDGQIFGITDASGKKLVHFNFLCKNGVEISRPPAGTDPETAKKMDWQHHVFLVHDGGDCYFQLDFDPESGEYGNLVVNGDA